MRYLSLTLPAARTALALAAALCASTASLVATAATPATDNAALLAQVQALAERVERLEAQNAQLRSAAQPASRTQASASAAAPLTAVADSAQAAGAPAEPEADLDQAASSLPAALQGISVEASLTGMVQQARRAALEDPTSGRSRANYRGDVAVTLPGGKWGGGRTGSIYVHGRFGQGEGLVLRPTYTGSANSTAFSGNDPDDTQFTVAQAWYQLDVPLGGAESGHKSAFTIGKIDPFVFFDQNGIVDDETRHFANDVFVHNPLLDSGGDVGADRFGFSPGVVAAYENTTSEALSWGASLGVFGSGNGASFNGSLGKPFVIAQAWVSPQINSLPGTYRLYAWNNARASNFDNGEARHSGFGVSIDQHVASALTLFGRYGQQSSGQVRFDRALTFSGEFEGVAWGRSDDGLGLALGLMRTSGAYATASIADPASYGYGARGSERVAELYYRIHLNDHVEITPSLQHIGRPGGDPDARAITLVGLRARVGF